MLDIWPGVAEYERRVSEQWKCRAYDERDDTSIQEYYVSCRISRLIYARLRDAAYLTRHHYDLTVILDVSN